MSTFLEQIVSVLTDSGLSPVFHSRLPEGPGTPDLTAVLMSGGLTMWRVHGTPKYERPRLRVLCRAEKWEDAEANARTAWNALIFSNVEIDGVRYLDCTPIDSPTDLGEDKNGRRLVGFNCQVIREVN